MQEDLNVGFFITAMGRSGTMWLAQLLDVDPHTKVFHEPVRDDGPLCVSQYKELVHERTKQYFENRKKVMLAKIAGHNKKRWGEVNGYLRWSVPEIQEVFGAPVIGLIRSGPLTVRSIFKRHNPFKELSGLNRFAAICDYWMRAYEKLMQDNIEIFRLEDLNTDFEFFRALCDMTGLRIGKKNWQRFAGKPIHISTQPGTPLEWSDEQWQIFKEIAGDTHLEFYDTLMD